MIYKNGKNIISVYKGQTTITKIYKGLNVVWESFKKLFIGGSLPLTLRGSVGKPLVDYKIYGNSKQTTLLPDGYQQVDYIEATGTQYFSINYKANQNTNSKGVFQITNTSKANFLFGAREGAVQGNCYGLNWGGGTPYKYYNTYYGNSNDGMTTVSIDDQKHSFEKISNQLYLDGALIHTRKDTDGTLEFETPNNLTIFACNTKGTIGLQTYARIYYLQISEGSQVVSELIPCYRKLDGEIGMYDLVTGTFHTNEGTGEFLKGENAPSPNAPLAVESLQKNIPVSINDDITAINLNEPLRKVGEYTDYIDYENQKVVRKVANVELNGSENWAVYRSNADNTVFNLDDTLTPLINAPISATYMSHFALTDISSTASFPTGVYRFGFSSTTLNITTTRLYVSSTHKTVDEFKTWLAENKPVIVYPLATPTEETVGLPEIQTHKGTNILDINTIVQPSNVEVTYKGK